MAVARAPVTHIVTEVVEDRAQQENGKIATDLQATVGSQQRSDAVHVHALWPSRLQQPALVVNDASLRGGQPERSLESW